MITARQTDGELNKQCAVLFTDCPFYLFLCTVHVNIHLIGAIYCATLKYYNQTVRNIVMTVWGHP